MTNNPAPMNPVYVLIVNETGKVDDFGYDVEIMLDIYRHEIARSTHRIVHIPGENANSAEQMREQIVAWLEGQAERAKQAREGQQNTQWGHENFGRFCASKDAIRAIQSLPLPEGSQPVKLALAGLEALANKFSTAWDAGTRTEVAWACARMATELRAEIEKLRAK